MGEILRNPTRAELDEAIEANFHLFFRTFTPNWPGGELHEGDGLFHFACGGTHPLFNGIGRVMQSPEGFAALLSRLQQEHADRKSPLYWWAWPTSEPANLCVRLEEAGSELGFNAVGMAASLAEQRPEPLPEGVTISEVRDSAALFDYLGPCQQSFGIPQEDLPRFHQALTALGYGEEQPSHHYVAKLHGNPVGCITLFLGAGVAGIYFVGTVKEARRVGIGRAVTLHALLAAKEAGYEHAILHASPQGDPVYRKLGFVEHYLIPLYVWSPSEGA